MNRIRVMGWLVSGLAIAWPLAAFEMRIDGDAMTLQAHDIPARDFFSAFARWGVEVSADPSIEVRVTGTYTNTSIQQVLDQVLDPHSFILEWDFLPGPVGDIRHLKSLVVFKPGARDRVQSVNAGGRMRILRMPGERGAEYIADELLVSAKRGTTVADFLAALRLVGGVLINSSSALGIYHVRLPPGTDIAWALSQLRDHSVIEHVEPNFVTRLPTGQMLSTATAARDPTRLPKGKSAPLAVLDSGLLPQAGLGELVSGHFDATAPDQAISDPNGHGTQMALIASGAISPDGVTTAPQTGTPLLAIRAFDDQGLTSSFSLLRAIDYSIQNGARVMSLSWGTETDSEFMRDALAYAMNRNLIVVAAVGNEPTGRPSYPAAYPGVIGVAALQADGSRWPQSNYGDAVDLAAPGTATLPVGHDGPPGGYAGTSIATAYVAGQIARYLEIHPGATPAQIGAALSGALRDAGEPGRDPYFGLGVLDANALLRGP